MYDRKKIRSAQNVTDVSFFVVTTFAKIGHIERLKFAGTEMNQHSGKT